MDHIWVLDVNSFFLMIEDQGLSSHWGHFLAIYLGSQTFEALWNDHPGTAKDVLAGAFYGFHNVGTSVVNFIKPLNSLDIRSVCVCVCVKMERYSGAQILLLLLLLLLFVMISVHREWVIPTWRQGTDTSGTTARCQWLVCGCTTCQSRAVEEAPRAATVPLWNLYDSVLEKMSQGLNLSDQDQLGASVFWCMNSYVHGRQLSLCLIKASGN